MNCMYRTLLAAVALAVSSVTASADTITVCADGCDYTSINAAINAASDGDVIQLAAETYFEGSQIDTLGKAITLRGVLDKAGEPASVLDGAGTHRVLICQSGESAKTVFENLVIQNGHEWNNGAGMLNQSSSPSLANCVFSSNRARREGGGMQNLASNPSITECRFSSNQAGEGGGVYNAGSSPRLTDCEFSGNETIYESAELPASCGGGMWSGFGSDPILVGCSFQGNRADFQGAGLFIGFESSPVLVDCVISGNSSPGSWSNALIGGGVFIGPSCSPAFTDCTFSGNSALYGGGMRIEGGVGDEVSMTGCVFLDNDARLAGGLWSGNETLHLLDCAFIGNEAIENGGGMLHDLGSSVLDRCTFKYNSAESGGGIWIGEGFVGLTDCLLCGNSVYQINGPKGTWAESGEWSCINDDCGLCPDPFEDDDGDGVPNIDDVCPGGEDSMDSDFDGSPDFCDGCPGDGQKTEPGECGCGVADTDSDGDGTPDCFECTGDLDGNGEVDASDLGLLIAAWNTDGSIVEGSDINGDGIVNAADLGLLIGAWGPCQ
jgi:hypothetical protein